MRRILAALSLALCLWWPAHAGWNGSPEEGGFKTPAVATGGFSLTYQSNVGSATTGTTTISYAGVTWGSGCNAVIIAVNWYNTNQTDTISSMTVGGLSASAIASTTVSPGNGNITSSIWELVSPSGTSGTVAVTYSANVTFNSSVAAYCLVSAHTTVSSSNSASAGSGANASTTVTVPAGGGAVVTGGTNTGVTLTWTNATQDAVNVGGGAYEAYAHTTSTGSVTVTDTPSSANANTVSVAAWGP